MQGSAVNEAAEIKSDIELLLIFGTNRRACRTGSGSTGQQVAGRDFAIVLSPSQWNGPKNETHAHTEPLNQLEYIVVVVHAQ